MSAALSPAERSVPTVAIVGNDAVLAAAPATPVQLAHACLRRGFTVAVPASWGDELVAAETVRQLADRDRGPAVMCVCPFVRSRLLAPGPDLAPFLVSLVAPSVAVARYVRAVYGDQAIHVTYIGSCPAADDPAIDVSLTPDSFFADIAEHGIALSEQPLVFDSIVPPDRRRWCSVPGGVPSPEVLWNEGDARTLVEIDRDDAPADIAQHIVTGEHVLLDLAPGLGCACSGAVPPLGPRSARVAVTALEPPRAFAPVIDGATIVSLDAPVRTTAPQAPPVTEALPNADPAPAPRTPVDDVLDQEIGTPVPDDVAARLVGLFAPESLSGPAAEQRPLPAVVPEIATAEAFADSTTTPRREVPNGRPLSPGAELAGTVNTGAATDPSLVTTPPIRPAAPVFDAEVAMQRHQEPASVIVAESDIETLVDSPVDVFREDVPETLEPEPEVPEPQTEPSGEAGADVEPAGRVRRRSPGFVSVRTSAAGVPRTTAAGGRLLPRAYVAKRRVPLSELVAEQSATSAVAEPAATAAMPDVEAPAPPDAASSMPAAAGAELGAVSAPPVAAAPPAPAEADATESSPPTAQIVAPRQTQDAPAVPPTASAPLPTPENRPRPSTDERAPRFSPRPDDSSGPGPLVILLLLALVGLTAFVIWMLSR